MVTVNYVFLCAFLNIGGEGCYRAWQQPMLMSKRYPLFLVDYKRNTLVSEKRKKQRKKITKKVEKTMSIFFFLSNTFQCDL